jgi:hypothetical protein
MPDINEKPWWSYGHGNEQPGPSFDWLGPWWERKHTGDPWYPGVDGPARHTFCPLFSPATYVLEDGVLWIGSWGPACAYGVSPWRKGNEKEMKWYMSQK